MSNVVFLNSPTAQPAVIHVLKELQQSVERIGSAALRMDELQLGSETHTSTMLDLYKVARIIERVAAVVERTALEKL